MSIIAVISDIHAERAALEAVRRDMGAVQAVWFLGDLFDRGEEPAWVYNRLLKYDRSGDVWLPGNHDLAIAYLHDPERYARWKGMYESLNDRFKESCKQQMKIMPGRYVEKVAEREVCAVREEEGLRVYLVHGFPSADTQTSLIRSYADSAPLNGHKVDYLYLHEAVTGRAHIWLVGHVHQQAAWLYGGATTGWQEWQPGFGVNLHGEKRLHTPSTQQSVTLAETGLDFRYLPEDAFLLLSPGSVGDSHDNQKLGGVKWAKYLRLEISDQTVRAHFRAVPFGV